MNKAESSDANQQRQRDSVDLRAKEGERIEEKEFPLSRSEFHVDFSRVQVQVARQSTYYGRYELYPAYLAQLHPVRKENTLEPARRDISSFAVWPPVSRNPLHLLRGRFFLSFYRRCMWEVSPRLPLLRPDFLLTGSTDRTDEFSGHRLGILLYMTNSKPLQRM
jgi:hypothetical protein